MMHLFKKQRKIRCHLAESSHDVFIGTNLFSQAGSYLKRILKDSREGQVVVLTHRKVATLYARVIMGSLRRAGFCPKVISLPEGEEAKSERIYFKVLNELARDRFERKGTIVALGGGVVGDLAGFVAATYMRGVPFVNFPTTLLAQVDSSIGGKTGINLGAGKNLVGTFYQPRLVLMDIAALASLPKKEVVNGLAEVIKYGVLFDEAFFAFLETRLDSILELDFNAITEMVFKCVQYKVKIVERDEKESGLRAALNFGHTFGHAFEAEGQFSKLSHGMAVALGMQAAGRLAVKLDMFESSSLQRLTRLIERAGLPISLAPYHFDLDALIKRMRVDKKVNQKKIKLILPEAIGSFVIRDDVSPSLIKRAMQF